MPSISVYAFDRSGADQAGPFWQNSVGHGTGPSDWAWVTIFNLAGSRSVLAWERVSSERVLDLSATANGPLALAQIDALLTSPASRRGAVRTSYVPWIRVPGVVRDPNPGLHQDWELLITLHIDFHVSTPWYCSDADGTLTFYVFPFLDGGGTLRGGVEGSSFHFDGGGPFCAGEIQSRIQNSLGGAMTALQNLLNTALPLFAAGQTFNMLYLLPGHGDMAFGSDNADNNVALAVIPN